MAGVEYIPVLRCGACGEVGALDPVRLADGRVALQAFREQGWRSESPDDERPESWWCCPVCATSPGGN
jgi:hypothetical protein